MAVKIRMKRLGRKHRSYFRICATDIRALRDGRVIEEIGSYDPTIPLTDARCKLDHERVKYWLGVGAKPSDRVSILIKKYGPEGTHLKQHEEALAQLKAPKVVPDAGPPAAAVAKKKKAAEEAPAEAAATESAPKPPPKHLPASKPRPRPKANQLSSEPGCPQPGPRLWVPGVERSEPSVFLKSGGSAASTPATRRSM